ncbi:MAG: MBL fold metallo-hydrolase [Acidimicrobiia bacterium]
MVNSYILYDETGDCILIDAACYEPKEEEEVRNFISDNKLNLVRNLNTHCHIDHVLGNGFISRNYQVNPEYTKIPPKRNNQNPSMLMRGNATSRAPI